MARRTSKLMSSIEGGSHWGAWLERTAQSAGYTKMGLSRAVGVHRKSVMRWYADARPPMESGHLNRLAKALRITRGELIAGGTDAPAALVPAAVVPAEDGLRGALATQLAAYARHLDVPELLELVRVGALMARRGMTTTTNVGDAHHGRGEGLPGPMVPGVDEESGQQSRFHPAPSSTAARAFLSSAGVVLAPVGDRPRGGGNSAAQVLQGDGASSARSVQANTRDPNRV